MPDGAVIRLSCPARTVSRSFRGERLLRKPSIHMCSSQLPFGPDIHERIELPFPESESGVLPIERSPIESVGLERFELSPHGLKSRCAAVTPQTQVKSWLRV